MDALGSRFVDGAYQVLVDLLGHERNHGSRCLGNGHQRGVKGHVGIDLILLHSLCPETLTASSYVPVAHVVHEILEGSCSLGDPVVGQIVVYLLHCGV